jgi:hypothetical protein
MRLRHMQFRDMMHTDFSLTGPLSRANRTLAEIADSAQQCA